MRILHVVTHLGLGGAEPWPRRSPPQVPPGTVSLLPIVGARDHAYGRAMTGGWPPGASGRRERGLIHGEDRNPRGCRPARADRVARRPDVVHLHTEIPEFAWALASVPSRHVRTVPVVRTVHNTVLWGGWGRMGRFAERRLAGARVAAVSSAARAAYVEWRAIAGVPNGEVAVIYNGVDASGLPDGPGEPGRPPLLCFAGRFEPQKGIDILLESVPRLTRSDPPFRVAIFGDGTLAPSVVAAAARSDGRIVVSPPMADLRARLGLFDAILMPSRFEGLSLLAVEALCAGIPILATAALGLDEVLPDSYRGVAHPVIRSHSQR